MRHLLPLLLAPLAVLAGCLAPQDDPTNVHDLRVLGVQTASPELMAPTCGLTPDAIRIFSAGVQYTALIADPAGAGRPLHYQLYACAVVGDRDCSDERVLLSEGDTTTDAAVGYGTLKLTLKQLALTTLSDGTLLIQRVLENDPYQGLGGLRLPLVLHLTAGDEDIFAQKLMVFSCAFFPGDSKQNVNPVLPGITLKGQPWGEGELPVAQAGEGPFKLEAMDFSGLEEDYVVPAFDLSEVHLHESWKIAWYSTLGSFAPGTTGGTNVSGEESKPFSEWKPPDARVAEQDVQFWMVVRDGRGGLSWLTRRLHYKPQP